MLRRRLLRNVLMTALAPGAVARAAGAREHVKTGRVPVEGGGSYTNVNVAGFAAMLAEKDFTFVNVHVPYEGDIGGTDLSIPFDQVAANLARLPSDKGTKLVLYCRSGRMSEIAARTLVKLGFRNVWNVDGGMVAWEEAGYPLVRARSTP
jgi:rhodanese-related sulfurtransferase